MNIIKYMFTHPREAAVLWIALIVVIAALVIIFTRDAGAWRMLYCQNPDHAIECAVKGWY